MSNWNKRRQIKRSKGWNGKPITVQTFHDKVVGLIKSKDGRALYALLDDGAFVRCWT